MRPFFALLGLLLGITVGCKSYDSPFVAKTEAELDRMEVTNGLAAEYFYKKSYQQAHSTLDPLTHELTVSSPQYMLERVSILLMQGEHDKAHALMMEARENIETLFDPESEEKAISYWHGENNKVFKGDNHERATLYALLALSFIERGEWEDAQRCVKNGLLADLSTEDQVYNSDYALLHYLGYFAAKKLGETSAAEDYKREFITSLKARGLPAELINSSYARLFDDTTEPNTLMVVWTGRAPSFYRGGEYEELRMIVPGSNPYTTMTLAIDDFPEQTFAKSLGDINYQATTRGGREMDNILENKAAVKKGMEVSRNIFIAAAAGCFIAAARQNDPNAAITMMGVGGGCLAIGAIPWIIGTCINTTADVRYWHNLPGEFLIMPLRLPEGNHTITLRGYHYYDNFVTESVQLPASTNALTVRHLALPQDRTFQLGNTKNHVTGVEFLDYHEKGSRLHADKLKARAGLWMQHELR